MIDNDDLKTGLGCFGAIVICILTVIFSPFLNFILCYFTGWLIKITFGEILCSGLLLFGLHIVPESIPLFCGTLGVIGSFLKSTTNINYPEHKN